MKKFFPLEISFRPLRNYRQTRAFLLMIGALCVMGRTAGAQATLNDLGTTAPTPGANDIIQSGAAGNTKKPDSLNYYTDNGAQNGADAGQTFKTGSNAGGYTLNSLAIRTAGLDDGGGYNNAQAYGLSLYSISGTTATLVQSFTSQNFSFTESTSGEWLQWTGIQVPLNASTTYAYGFGRTSSGAGWCALGVASGNPYNNGEIGLIPANGGTITNGTSHQYDGIFDLGLSLGAVVLPPSFSQPPLPQTLYPGKTATFTATVTGAKPISYQWQKNSVGLTDGGNISGSRTNTLLIKNIGVADMADYTLVASNSVNMQTSAPVALTVLSAPTPGSYPAAVLAANPVAYWQLNDTGDPSTNNTLAFDNVGGLNGIYGVGAEDGLYGIAGPQPPTFPGFPAGNGALLSATSINLSAVTAPALNLNTNAVTNTAWVTPASLQAGYQGIFAWRLGSDGAGLTFSTNNMLGYVWNTNAATTWGYNSQVVVPSNQWSLAAVTIAPTRAIRYLFNASGVHAATNTLAHGQEAFSSACTIANDTASGGRIFSRLEGMKVAVFNYTMTKAQLQSAMYSAATNAVAPSRHFGHSILRRQRHPDLGAGHPPCRQAARMGHLDKPTTLLSGIPVHPGGGRHVLPGAGSDNRCPRQQFMNSLLQNLSSAQRGPFCIWCAGMRTGDSQPQLRARQPKAASRRA